MSPIEREALEKFGEVLIQKVRDEAIEQWDRTLDGTSTAPALKKVRDALSPLSAAQNVELKKIVSQVVDTTIHHLLWTLEQDSFITVQVKLKTGTVDNISSVSDGLAGELYSDDGWIRKYSRERYHSLL